MWGRLVLNIAHALELFFFILYNAGMDPDPAVQTNAALDPDLDDCLPGSNFKVKKKYV
jgi:hypothetical protein